MITSKTEDNMEFYDRGWGYPADDTVYPRQSTSFGAGYSADSTLAGRVIFKYMRVIMNIHGKPAYDRETREPIQEIKDKKFRLTLKSSFNDDGVEVIRIQVFYERRLCYDVAGVLNSDGVHLCSPKVWRRGSWQHQLFNVVSIPAERSPYP